MLGYECYRHLCAQGIAPAWIGSKLVLPLGWDCGVGLGLGWPGLWTGRAAEEIFDGVDPVTKGSGTPALVGSPPGRPSWRETRLAVATEATCPTHRTRSNPFQPAPLRRWSRWSSRLRMPWIFSLGARSPLGSPVPSSASTSSAQCGNQGPTGASSQGCCLPPATR